MSESSLTRSQRTADLLRILVPREFRTRYRQSVLDVAWSLITPLVFLAVYGVILTRSFSVDGACSPYLTSAWTGLVLWTFFSAAVGGATWSLIVSVDLITKIYFPREALPLAVVGATATDLGIGLVTVFALILVQGVALTWTAGWLVLPLLIVLLWSAGLGVFLAAFSVFLRDVSHAVQLLLRVGFFATPVMYEASFLPDELRWTASVNPVAAAIGGARDSLLCGHTPNLSLMGVQIACGALVLLGAIQYTRRVEARMVDVI